MIDLTDYKVQVLMPQGWTTVGAFAKEAEAKQYANNHKETIKHLSLVDKKSYSEVRIVHIDTENDYILLPRSLVRKFAPGKLRPNPNTWIVYTILTYYYKKSKHDWFEVPDFRMNTGLGNKAIDRALKELKEAGWINMTQRHNGVRARYYLCRNKATDLHDKLGLHVSITPTARYYYNED